VLGPGTQETVRASLGPIINSEKVKTEKKQKTFTYPGITDFECYYRIIKNDNVGISFFSFFQFPIVKIFP
jgi:hypothetical protein